MSDKTKEDGAKDYRATLFLPQTEFPMKAGLPEAEPKWLARWEAMNLYARIRQGAKGKPLFILHDGPPYANGEIHSGTGLNKILKDFVVRSQTMLGKDAPYVPGWDCHGLPIEWKIEEKYRAEGKSKDDVPIDQLRRDCREFAKHWIDVQRDQFKRLGCMGEWDHPYTTMNYRAEAIIAGELHKFVANGLLYRGFRPVMWSPVEKTALAEAEVEYKEKQSPTIYVKFPIVTGEHAGASVVIWTTTPWTIPGNRAIAFSHGMDYALYEIVSTQEGSFGKVGDVIALSDVLAGQTASHAKIELRFLCGIEPSGMICAHPFRGQGYDFDVPLLAGEHVTADTGTGFVHTAPGHGEDDFELLVGLDKQYPAKYPDAFAIVGPDGSFNPQVPLFAGKRILTPEGKDGDANGAVIKELIAANGKLLAKGSLRHQYPHTWRSKAPVIFRATPQWFAAMDKPFIERQDAARARDARHRRHQMVSAARARTASARWWKAVPTGCCRASAPGACRLRSSSTRRPAKSSTMPPSTRASRTRSKTKAPMPGSTRRRRAFSATAAIADDYEQVKDILDVWFDSGSTHVFTVEQPIEPSWPKKDRADLYLEGSDQHRGWFQSSLLESCGTHRPRAVSRRC